jgi:hypothetical protein
MNGMILTMNGNFYVKKFGWYYKILYHCTVNISETPQKPHKMKSITYRPNSFLLLNCANVLTIKNSQEIFTVISIIYTLLSNIRTIVSKELQKRLGFSYLKNTIHTFHKKPQNFILVGRINRSWFNPWRLSPQQ